MPQKSISKTSLSNDAPVIGIDLGGTKILAAVVNKKGEILTRKKKRTRVEKPYQEVIARIASCARRAAEEANIPLSSIAAVGIGAPGGLNPSTGIISIAPNLNWRDVPLKDILAEDLGIPVFVGNDVNVGILGEHRLGAGVGVKNLVGIFVGTGIGGGLILDGKLYEGSSFLAGEIGHIPVVDDGPLCGCGNRGCLEAVAGRLAIVRDIKEAVEKGKKTVLTQWIDKDLSRVKSNLLARAWEEKDPLTVRVLKRAARYIGRGVATVISLLNPDVVVLGGGLIEALDDNFLKHISESVKKSTFPATFKETRIVRALLGDDAGIIGAAFYARDRLSPK